MYNVNKINKSSAGVLFGNKNSETFVSSSYNRNRPTLHSANILQQIDFGIQFLKNYLAFSCHSKESQNMLTAAFYIINRSILYI